MAVGRIRLSRFLLRRFSYSVAQKKCRFLSKNQAFLLIVERGFWFDQTEVFNDAQWENPWFASHAGTVRIVSSTFAFWGRAVRTLGVRAVLNLTRAANCSLRCWATNSYIIRTQFIPIPLKNQGDFRVNFDLCADEKSGLFRQKGLSLRVSLSILVPTCLDFFDLSFFFRHEVLFCPRRAQNFLKKSTKTSIKCPFRIWVLGLYAIRCDKAASPCPFERIEKDTKRNLRTVE